MIFRMILFFVSLGLFPACSKPEMSKFNHAIGPAEVTWGGPHGRFEFLRQGFSTNFNDYKVCIELAKGGLGISDVLFETKLAYALWLEATGFGEREFLMFNFTVAEKCLFEDVNFDSVIQFTSFAKERKEENLRSRFNQPTIECWRTQTDAACHGPTLTLGWGGPGGLILDNSLRVSKTFPSSMSF